MTRQARIGASLFALLLVPAAARAQAIETEHLFGFTIGSDVGDVGEKELEGSVTGRVAKRMGNYDAGQGTMSAEFVPMQNLRTEFTAVVNSFDISGVSGFADQHYFAPGGFSADIRYRLLDRATAPFGFAVGAEPHWSRADDITGEAVNQYGVDFVAVILIARRHVIGGETRVFQAHGPHGVRFTLEEPWSMLLMDDARVIHETTPLQPAGEGGARDTLVLTYRAAGFQVPG